MKACLELLEDVIISAISTSMAVTSIKAKPIIGPKALTINLPPLKRVLCTYYPMQFKRDQAKTQTLIDFGSKINAITRSYTIKLGFKV